MLHIKFEIATLQLYHIMFALGVGHWYMFAINSLQLVHGFVPFVRLLSTNFDFLSFAGITFGEQNQ